MYGDNSIGRFTYNTLERIMNIAAVVSRQRKFFDSGVTRPTEFRIAQLKKFEAMLRSHEALLLDAIYADLKKSPYDTYSSELSLLYREISFMMKNISHWNRKRWVRTNLVNFPARSYLLPEPYGVTFISGVWNYPYQLTLLPLVDSLAAGNTAIVKPSEVAPHTSAAMATLINTTFPEEYCTVIEGGADTAKKILEQKFDKIFFTGGSAIGRIVYKAAAKQFTPVTLELGGKNPAIVLRDCDIPVTAKRLVWGKLYNAGQTCVAVDYVLVPSSLEARLLDELKHVMETYYPTTTVSDNYMAIVNEKHFLRLQKMVRKAKVLYGGHFDKKNLFISPTILHDVSFNDAIMQDEIFGPILPVIRYDNLDAAIERIRSYPKPLSLYLFGSNNDEKEKIFHRLSFGGGSLNDTIMYFINDHLPLGGIGESGIGSYHGFEGFKAFTHYKSIMEKPTWFEPFLKYPPYSGWKLKILRFLIEKI